jgi:hypothetical protein
MNKSSSMKMFIQEVCTLNETSQHGTLRAAAAVAAAVVVAVAAAAATAAAAAAAATTWFWCQI